MSLLIKGGRVIDPASGIDDFLDIFIQEEKITKISKNLDLSGSQLIEAAGKVVSPGFIDIHTHLREPGREDEETIASGTRAAVRGGFTTVCCMPNTNPPIDEPSLVEFIYQQAKLKGVIEVLPIATITRKREGKNMAELGRLHRAGAIAFSDDGDWVADSNLMRRALEYTKMLGAPVISHPEDKSLSRRGVMNEGYFSTILGLEGIPREAEEIAVFRDLVLAKMTRSPLHLAHISTQGSIKLIREAKEKRIRVTAEVTPHHFTLTDEVVRNFDTNTKINPPLRTQEDINEIKKALKEGVIEVIATDHAPHSPEEKELDYPTAPFGIIGLETALGLIVRELVETKILTLTEAMAKLTINPAQILGLDRGYLREGGIANIAIFDPESRWRVTDKNFSSLSKNSPFIGWELPARVNWTIFRGKVVYKKGLDLNI